MIAKRFLVLMILFFILIAADNLQALDVKTHAALNEYIAGTTLDGFTLDHYLKKQSQILPFGINQTLTQNKTVQQWVHDGGEYEDEPPWTVPYVRSANHFHNPLQPLGQAGYTGWPSGVSAILWSQEAPGTQSPGGCYSWLDVRHYFLEALISRNPNDRTSNFAETFRGLGQLMHLVQDMSVPEHVRNSFHAFGGYEGWVLNDAQYGLNQEFKAIYNTALASPIFFDFAALNQASPFGDETRIPIARLFDSRQYNNGTVPVILNPSITMNPNTNNTRIANVGLSEYTSANFVSPTTIFTAGFPYPSLASSGTTSTIFIDDKFNPGHQVKRTYYLKNGDGDSGYLLAIKTLLVGVNSIVNPNEPILKELAPMDYNVYKGYAAKLLPRAVGYSAGLLRYFFRGDIDIAPDPMGTAQYVIKNYSNEMLIGNFSLYYDDVNGIRSPLNVSWGDLNISANSQSLVADFTRPSNAVSYILVFDGQMGWEEESKIGKVIPDLLLPPPTLMSNSIYGPSHDNGLEWNNVTGGNGKYKITINKGTNTVVNDLEVDGTHYWNASKLTPGSYTLKIRTESAAGNPGPPSAPIAFTVYGYPSAPTNLFPIDYQFPWHNPILKWDSVPGAKFYNIQIYGDYGSYTATSIALDSCTGGRCEYDSSQKNLSDWLWYWKVQTVDVNDAASNWSYAAYWIEASMEPLYTEPQVPKACPSCGVYVFACLDIAIKDVPISYTVLGNPDNYQDNDTYTTGDNGCIRIYVPGNTAPGTVDTVTATVAGRGITGKLKYTFQ